MEINNETVSVVVNRKKTILGKKSVVQFIINEKLIDFIVEVQNKYRHLLEDTITLREERDFEAILEIQRVIRHYILDNRERVDFSIKDFVLQNKSSSSMSSLFGLYMMVVSDLSKVENIIDVMEQIEKREYILFDELISQTDGVEISFDATETGTDQLCCCSHWCLLKNMSMIRNNITQYSIVVGCECVKKYELIDKDVVLREVKKTKTYIGRNRKSDEIKDKNRFLKEEEEARIIEGKHHAYLIELEIERLKSEEIRRLKEEERLEELVK